MNTLFNALLFYTRLPIPFKVECTSEILSRAIKYLPIVGLIVGAIGWLTFWVASTFANSEVAVLLSIIAMVLSTGAFHEDGFADFCDGFGGGYGKEAILRIMKDSHIGCYGVIALILLFISRYTLINSVALKDMAMVLILSQGASRFAPVWMVRSSTYARSEPSKSSHSSLGVSRWGVVVAMIFALLPLPLLGYQFATAYIAVMIAAFLLFRAYIHRHIEGFTGDTLGALQIICELLFYLTYLIVKAI